MNKVSHVLQDLARILCSTTDPNYPDNSGKVPPSALVEWDREWDTKNPFQQIKSMCTWDAPCKQKLVCVTGYLIYTSFQGEVFILLVAWLTTTSYAVPQLFRTVYTTESVFTQ